MLNFLILAAGKGTRLMPITRNIPKCMVKIQGESLIDKQINVIKNNKYKKIYVAVGYKKNKIKREDIIKIANLRYQNTNMLYTLFEAIKKIKYDNDLIISYGDIVYQKNVLSQLIKSKANFSVCIDLNWKKYWKKRFRNPLIDAETLDFNSNGYLNDIGRKTHTYKEIKGQYIGLIKIKKTILKDLVYFYSKLKIINKNNLFLTDFIQILIKNKWKIKTIPIKGGWLEIDNISDLFLIEKLIKNKKINSFYQSDA